MYQTTDVSSKSLSFSQAAMNLPMEFTRQLAWETVAGISYVPLQATPPDRPAVVRAAGSADWRRQGFSFVAKV